MNGNEAGPSVSNRFVGGEFTFSIFLEATFNLVLPADTGGDSKASLMLAANEIVNLPNQS